MDTTNPAEARDAALRRLNRLTVGAGLAAVAGLGIFSAVSAATIPGTSDTATSSTSTASSASSSSSDSSSQSSSSSSSTSGSTFQPSAGVSTSSGRPHAVSGASS
jgi:F-type H+/Na+-transporting ATPase subunit beta